MNQPNITKSAVLGHLMTYLTSLGIEPTEEVTAELSARLDGHENLAAKQEYTRARNMRFVYELSLADVGETMWLHALPTTLAGPELGRFDDEQQALAFAKEQAELRDRPMVVVDIDGKERGIVDEPTKNRSFDLMESPVAEGRLPAEPNALLERGHPNRRTAMMSARRLEAYAKVMRRRDASVVKRSLVSIVTANEGRKVIHARMEV